MSAAIKHGLGGRWQRVFGNLRLTGRKIRFSINSVESQAATIPHPTKHKVYLVGNIPWIGHRRRSRCHSLSDKHGHQVRV